MWTKVLVIYCVFKNVMASHNEFDEIFAWKQLNYSNLPADKCNICLNRKWSNLRTVLTSVFTVSNSDYYVPKNNIPFGVTRHGDWLYIGCPRRRIGVPSTLNRIRISSASVDRSPRLEGYPNYDLNDIIVSTLRKNFTNYECNISLPEWITLIVFWPTKQPTYRVGLSTSSWRLRTSLGRRYRCSRVLKLVL